MSRPIGYLHRRMAATIIDGKAVAKDVREAVKRDAAAWLEQTGSCPALATILVGDDPASAVYIASKRRACAEAGIADHHRHLPADCTQDEVGELIEQLNANPEVSGILLQLPVPKPLDGQALTARFAPRRTSTG